MGNVESGTNVVTTTAGDTTTTRSSSSPGITVSTKGGRNESSRRVTGGLLSAAAASSSNRTKHQSNNMKIVTTAATTPRTTNTAKNSNINRKDNNKSSQPNTTTMRHITFQEEQEDCDDVRQPEQTRHRYSPKSPRESPTKTRTTTTTRPPRYNKSDGSRHRPIPIGNGSRYDPIPLTSVESSDSILNDDDNVHDHALDEKEMKNEMKQNDDDDDEVENLLKKISALGDDMLEASAAVFHYLEKQNNNNINNRIGEHRDGGDLDLVDDDMSMTSRSNAVLAYVQNEARKGNTIHAYKLLETAKAVKEVLEEEGIVTTTKERVVSPPSPHLVIHDKYARRHHQQQHHRKYDYDGGGGGDADDKSISEQSMAIFRILESIDSHDGGGGGFRLRSPFRYREQQPLHGDGNYDDFTSPTKCVHRDPPGVGKTDLFEKLTSGWYGALSPKSQRTKRAGGRGGGGGDDLNCNYDGDNDGGRYSPDIPEMKSTAEESDSGDDGLNMDNGEDRRDLNAVLPIVVEGRGGSGVDLTDLPHLHVIGDDIDLEFVENFELAFNEFVARHPDFVERFPELVHHLRISKLQKLLEYNELKERNMMAKLTSIQGEKSAMEQKIQLQLRAAARKKAARQTLLQSELNDLSWSTKRIQAQLRWKFLQYSVDRAKRQYKIRQQFKAIPRADDRHELLDLIPNNQQGQAIRDAIGPTETSAVDDDKSRTSVAVYAGDSRRLEKEQEERQMREYQKKNTALNEEISLLNKRLAYLQMEAKKFAWVESILLRMDDPTMIRLKSKFEKKEGITHLS